MHRMNTVKYLIITSIWLIFSFASFASTNAGKELLESKTGQTSKHHIEALLSNTQNIIGIEHLLADGLDDRIASKWGHSLLRFVDNDDNPLNDIVLSFVAFTPPDRINNLKALTGGYAVIPVVTTLAEMWNKYTLNEGRIFTRTIIQTNSEIRTNLITDLAEWRNDPAKYGRYGFLNNNCAGILKDYLQDSGIQHLTSGGLAPTSVDDWLAKGLITSTPNIRFTTSPKAIFETAMNTLGLNFEQFYSGKNWPANSYELLSTVLTWEELSFIYIQHTFLPAHVAKSIVKNKPKKKAGYIDTYLGHKPIPSILYQLCTDVRCARNFVEMQGHVWDKEALTKMREQMGRFYKYNLRMLKEKKWNASTIRQRKIIEKYEHENFHSDHYILINRVGGINEN